PERIFHDIDGIAPGARFPSVIHSQLESCDVVLALIGKGWLTAKDRNRRRRLDDPDDVLRQEIRAALERDDVLVIPVLVDGGTMPDREALPEDLWALTERNAVRLSSEGWKNDLANLLRVLEREVHEDNPPGSVVHEQAADRPRDPAGTPPWSARAPGYPAAPGVGGPGPWTTPWQPAPPQPVSHEPARRRSPFVPIAIASLVMLGLLGALAFLVIQVIPDLVQAEAITLSQDSGPPGTEITVDGSGFAKNDAIVITGGAEPASARTDREGRFYGAVVRIPATAKPGEVVGIHAHGVTDGLKWADVGFTVV
ncbi:MAG: hypothetical protein ACRD12_16505, partial [Acidimicrobiales bacterium]